MLLVDPRSERARRYAEALRDALGAASSDSTPLDPDLRVVIGGDGWLLHCIQQNGPTLLYLGLNSGNLGFLLNDLGTPESTAAALLEARFTAHSFPRLAMDAIRPDGTRQQAVAVNDLYMERKTGQTAQLRVAINGNTVVERLICDGILVATALGSTAYSFSAGGVPCHPGVKALHLTPICPHSPRLSPVVLPLEASIDIEVLSPERRPVGAAADGIDQGPVQSVHIARAPNDVRLAFLEGHEFTRTLIRKVLNSG